MHTTATGYHRLERQDTNARAHRIGIVAPNHVDHLHLGAERLYIGSRHIPQQRTLARCTEHASIGVNAMFREGQQGSTRLMPIWVDTCNNEIAQRRIRDDVLHDFIDTAVLSFGLPHNRQSAWPAMRQGFRKLHIRMWAQLLITLALGILLFGPCLVRRAAADEPQVDQPSAEEIAQAQKQVEDELARLQGARGRVQPITEEPVVKTFPTYLFFSVVFRQFPVARLIPASLQSGNVYAVPRDQAGQLHLFTDTEGLEAFFRSTLGSIQDDNTAKDVARAWLHLAPVFSQDGFYQFVLQEDSIKVRAETPGRKVSGKVVVMAGGNGEIAATLAFDVAGKLAHVSQTANLRPGPRPICQATKLLDADPIVRRMAEQDLLILGRTAQEYLAAQRARASPELQQAIDQLWQRIVAEGR